jgi:hypothetical protein
MVGRLGHGCNSRVDMGMKVLRSGASPASDTVLRWVVRPFSHVKVCVEPGMLRRP